MAEIAIGIDLGTSNSCVAVVRRGAPEVLPNAFGEPTSASVVTFQQDGSALVGNAAKANLIHDPINTVASPLMIVRGRGGWGTGGGVGAGGWIGA